jgi:hypothetical protein
MANSLGSKRLEDSANHTKVWGCLVDKNVCRLMVSI